MTRDYVKTGKVKYVFRNYAFRGPDAVAAAEAAECAAEQNVFWPYHHILYQKQGAEGAGTFSRDRLKQYARDVPGIDLNGFNACFDSGKYRDKVAQDRAAGNQAGVNVTPTIFVGDEKIEGAPTREYIYPLIDQKLR